jgi:molecular chaperone GrpE
LSKADKEQWNYMNKKKGLSEQPHQEEQETAPEIRDQDGDVEIIPDALSVEGDLESLQSSLDEMTSKADEYLDGWQRARAEFANYKKRILKENLEIHQTARGEVIKLYLDILDDLQRALDEKPAQGEGKIWADGIELIVQKLNNRLEAEGVIPMNSLGEEFDPTIHEALMKEESDEYESGQIIEVMQEGYWIGEKVLRPALVRVAA